MRAFLLLPILGACSILWDPDSYVGDSGIPDAQTDAGVSSELIFRWVRQLGGPLDEEALALVTTADGVLVGGYLDVGAQVDSVSVTTMVPTGFVATFDDAGMVVAPVRTWPASVQSRITGLGSSGATTYAVGRWTGTATGAERSTGAFDGWVGTVEGGGRFATIATWGGPGPQSIEALAVGDSTLVLGGFATTTLELSDRILTPVLDQDAAFVELDFDKQILTAELVSGDDVGSDRGAAVAVDANSGYYVAGRVQREGSFNAFVHRIGMNAWTHEIVSSTGLTAATSLASPSRNQICVGGHSEGTVDLGEGLVDAVNDLAFVHCRGESDVIWVRHFDGTGLDRVLALDIGDGVMVAAGIYDGTLVLDTVEHTADGEDVFLVAMDPTSGDPIADVVLTGSGNLSVSSLSVVARGDNARVYLVGSFSGSIELGDLSTRGSRDGFVAAFDLIRP